MMIQTDNNHFLDVEKDIELIIWSMQLTSVFRYSSQRFWEKETIEHEYSLRINGSEENGKKVPRSESVAEHSWHMADMILIIGPKFKNLDLGKCLQIAILHDKLEILTGDKNPIGRNGKGNKTHAFNSQKKILKNQEEIIAFEKYKEMLNIHAQTIQEKIFNDCLNLHSIESKFVKALDRLQPIVYILKKKNGDMQDDHIIFTLKYTSTYKKYFPDLTPYYNCLINELFKSISKKRNIGLDILKQQFNYEQLTLFDF